jgi:hypothetical protein
MAKVNAGPQAGEGTVWFDYFVVTNATTNVSSTSSTTSTSTGSASSTTNSSLTTPTGKKSNLGPILGGVIGGVVLFLILLLCLWRYRRRVNNSGKVAQLKPDIDPDPSSRESPLFLYQGLLRNLRFCNRSNKRQPHLTIRHQLSERRSISFGLQSHRLNRQFKQALLEQLGTRLAAKIFPSPRHELHLQPWKLSVDPSGFAESLAGSSSFGRPTSAGASSKSRHLLRPPSEGTVSTFLPPVQHVDSGMRSIDMEMLTNPPELPPVYSPV